MFNTKLKQQIQQQSARISELESDLQLQSKQLEDKRNDIIFKDSKISALMNDIKQLQSTIEGYKIKLKNFDSDSKEFFEYLRLKDKISEYRRLTSDLELELKDKSSELKSITNEYIEKSAKIQEYNDYIHLETIGVYYPKFDYGTPQEYKDKIKEIKAQQKEMAKANKICQSTQEWSVNGSSKNGAYVTKSLSKLGALVFNLQCDNIIKRINHININQSLLDIDKLFNQLNDIFKLMAIEFNFDYKNLKKDEARLVHEHELKKQEIKAQLAEERERIREQEIIEKEALKEKERLEQEKAEFIRQMNGQDDEQLQEIISGIDVQIEKVNYRLANQKFGFVYCISNPSIPNSVKIGITRRGGFNGSSEYDRVEELSATAGLPFKYVCHCMAFSEDCFKDEAELHQLFADRKVNLFNPRKEHFYITLDEAEKAFKDRFGDSIDFDKDVVNEDYVYSQEVRENMSGDVENEI